MRVIVLPSKGDLDPKKISGDITNSFIDFGKLWDGDGDEGWIGSSHSIMEREEFLSEMDIIFTEMTWRDTWQSQMVEFKKRHPDKPKVVCFTGSASRFYVNCAASVFSAQVAALESIDAIGTMNHDMIRHYENFGNIKKVFHMPCPMDPEFYKKQVKGDEKEKSNKRKFCY